ncbi:MAG: hypothetical protein FJ293_10235 [Planctomycetes bacterium]|nr:hypothetical protein [Planctomycetota bacterium]
MRYLPSRWLSIVTAATCVAALVVACGGGDSRSRKSIRGRAPEAASTGSQGGGAQASGVKTIDPANSGTITGVVRWAGAAIKPIALDLSGNPDCARVAKETVYDETLVVNADDTVCNALVSIDTADVYAPPAEPAIVDQVGCKYVPHVFALMAGQSLKIKSSDATLHNVHYIPLGDVNQEDNFAMPAPGVRERVFESNDWIKFKCDVHPWMVAWCAVRTHPFFAVTGTDGKFTLNNVPAGTHKLVLKHESLGEQSVSITVEVGKVATQEFTLKK